MRVLIEFEKKPLLFQHPQKIISCYQLKGLKKAFQEAEESLARGFYLAGFLAYEAGYAFEEKLFLNKQYEFPLIYLGCYRAPAGIGDYTQRFDKSWQISDLEFNIRKNRYFQDIDRIRYYIAQGEVYQITYCLKMNFSWQGHAFSFYKDLFRKQPVPYPVYLCTDKFIILSLSPEMFIFKKDGFIRVKPMKGTWPRGKNVFSDLWAGFKFKRDLKNRAENVMITDLLRNDLGRIGQDIKVPGIFQVDRYNLLYQMTSTVTGKIKKDILIWDLFSGLFPSGSVTGAPKIRAMEIIRKLEDEERKIYTGAIGYITPDKDMFFNVPIRTLLLSQGRGEMGIGGGIVWDSTAQGEWEEGILKGKFLADSCPVNY